jgi:RNA recognition motif-containing protein
MTVTESATATTVDAEAPQPAAVDESTKDESASDTQTSASSPEALLAVAERLRFFFSDANLRQDYFMRKYLMNGDDHAVPVEVLLRFNTIKQHTESTSVVVQAARQLPDVLVVSQDETKISLVVPFTEAKMDENIPLSLYLCNLPVNESKKKYDVTTEDVRNLFDNAGHIVLVKLRFRHADAKDTDDISDLQPSQQPQSSSGNGKAGHKKGRRVPTGAALVEFDSLEELRRAAAETITTAEKGGALGETESKPSKPLTLGGSPLSVMLLRDYIDSCKAKSNASSDTTSKRKSSTDVAVAEDNAVSKTETEPDEAAKSPNAFTMDWKPGCVIALKGIATTEPCDREGILSAVAAFLETTVAEMKANKTVYVDFSRGQTEGAIRFTEPSESVEKLCAKLQSGEITIAGAKVESAVVLQGEAETAYWNNFIAFKSKQLQQRTDERGSSRNKHHNKRTRRN